MCKIWTLQDPETLNTKCITIIKTKAHSPGCLATYTLGQSGTLRYAKIITRTPSQLQAQSNTILSSTSLSVFTTLCAVVSHLFGARSLSKTCQSVHWQVLQALSPLYRNLLCPSYRFIICGLLIIFWKLSSLKCRLRGVFSLLHRGLQHFMALPHVC